MAECITEVTKVDIDGPSQSSKDDWVARQVCIVSSVVSNLAKLSAAPN